uniref:Transposase IS4 n=1 Tax=Trepomonas sp. PC1 TaxID=1076344 RepID=A0A146KLF9_9EUKA|eukprot:JAP96221.1 Transposase IS4 [Trepomonas sp. PC1]
MYILLVMMLCPRRDMQEYWSNNQIYTNIEVKNTMQRDQFFQIYRRVMYGVDGQINEEFFAADDLIKNLDNKKKAGQKYTEEERLLKIQAYQERYNKEIQRSKHYLNYIEERFAGVYEQMVKSVEKPFFALDETLVPWNGWVPMKQYLPDKPHSYGLLARVLVTGRFHYVVSFEMYFGSKNDVSNSVKDLVTRMANKVHMDFKTRPCLVVDNYYTTIDSITSAHDIGWDIIGTIRPNRCQGKSTKKMKLEHTKITKLDAKFDLYLYEKQVKKNKMLPLVDSRHVRNKTRLIALVSRYLERVRQLYVEYYCGVDKIDALLSYIRFPHKIQNWTLTIFIYGLQMGILNAFALYKIQTTEPQSIRPFVEGIAAAYKKRFEARKSTQPQEQLKKQIFKTHSHVPIQAGGLCQENYKRYRACNNSTRNQCSCGFMCCKACYLQFLVLETIESVAKRSE